LVCYNIFTIYFYVDTFFFSIQRTYIQVHNDICQLSDQFYRYDKFFHLWECHSIYQSPLEDGGNLIKFVRNFLGKISEYFSNPDLLLKILYVSALIDSRISLCHLCIYWTLQHHSTVVLTSIMYIILKKRLVGMSTNIKNVLNTS
jgi:hypothetical protein